jgi:hypothetical protein
MTLLTYPGIGKLGLSGNLPRADEKETKESKPRR